MLIKESIHHHSVNAICVKAGSTGSKNCSRPVSIFLSIGLVLLLTMRLSANPISVTDNSGELQVGLGTSNNNAAIVTTTGVANEL